MRGVFRVSIADSETMLDRVPETVAKRTAAGVVVGKFGTAVVHPNELS